VAFRCPDLAGKKTPPPHTHRTCASAPVFFFFPVPLSRPDDNGTTSIQKEKRQKARTNPGRRAVRRTRANVWTSEEKADDRKTSTLLIGGDDNGP